MQTRTAARSKAGSVAPLRRAGLAATASFATAKAAMKPLHFPGNSEMLHAIETGVPLETIAAFVASSGVELKDVYEIVIPARTLKHRRARKEPLSLNESDRLARLMRIFDRTLAVFRDLDLARDWLNKPKKRFSEQTPLRMLRTEVGGRMVEEMLGQIDEGMFA